MKAISNVRCAQSLLALLACLTSLPAAETPTAIEADVCVYGGTSGGVVAAVQAARMGKTAVIVEPGKHLGGMTAGGLSAVDIGDPRSVGGIAREYFTKLVGTYGKTLAWGEAFEGKGGPATGGAFAIEPHTAERLFDDMAREAKVPVHFGARLARVNKDGTRIVELVTEDGTIFRAKVFIDATYEGDLMAKAGVSYTLQREGNAKYGETFNGIHYAPIFQPRTNHQKPGPNGRAPGGQGVWDRDLPLDPYVVPGDPRSGLLPLVNEGEPGRAGESAPGVQAYCFRLCLTTAADRIPITPPRDYDPKRYEIVARFIAACLAIGDDLDLRWFSKHDPLPNDKWDFNTATFGSNLPGASWEWPEASHARREQIAKEHENYHRGLLHFLATDPRVPAKVRDEMKRFGLPRDEFTDHGGWPHQLYIREARRMVSDLVLTEHHTFGREVAPNPISLGSYGTDTHEIRRIVKNGVVAREGKTAGGRGGFGPYHIGYGAIVPKAAECENLFVTFALSASHTAFSSIRMEPVFMATSQSAATAACFAIDDKVPVQKVDYPKLRARLVADRQVVEWKESGKAAAEIKPKATATAESAMNKAGDAEAAVETAHRELWRRLVDEHNVVLDYADLDGRIIRPTPEDCRELKPSALSWGVPVEDGPMFNGLYLDALCNRWKITHAEEDRKKARRLVDGLLFLASRGRTPGFIARGVATDGRTTYPMGSNDQTGPWLYGMWRYLHDGFAEGEERAALVAKFVEIVQVLDAQQWRMPCDGPPSPYRGSFAHHSWEAAPRLLFVLKAMQGLTGDAKWQARYLEAANERGGNNQRTRLDFCRTGMVFDPSQGARHSWTGSAGVVCLRALWEMETDPALRDAYAQGLRASAELSAQSLPLCANLDPNGNEHFEHDWHVMNEAWKPQASEAEAVAVASAGLRVQHRASPRLHLEKDWVREPCFAAWVVTLCPDAAFVAQHREAILKVITHYHYDRLYLSQFFPVESAWWRLAATPAVETPGAPTSTPVLKIEPVAQ
ncbi:MAG: hypothetical protein QOE70_112 [Chthoniobacter sp.]|jgi:hypothetical protein|nr:hypothetical protein [Chthoniobacter sp.]